MKYGKPLAFEKLRTEAKTCSKPRLKAIYQQVDVSDNKKYSLQAEKAYQLILKHRMKGIDKAAITELIKKESAKENFNLYQWVESFEKHV